MLLFRHGLWIAIVFLLTPAPSLASAFSLDVGAYSDNLAQRFSAPSGYGNEVSQISGFLRARPILALSSTSAFEPSFAVLLPWRSGEDGFAKVLTTIWGLDFAVNWSWFKLRMGPGIQWSITFSDASTVDLNNGTSTSTFYLPGETSANLLFMVEGGIEFAITKDVSFGLETWFTEVTSRARRRVHGAAFIGVRL